MLEENGLYMIDGNIQENGNEREEMRLKKSAEKESIFLRTEVSQGSLMSL